MESFFFTILYKLLAIERREVIYYYLKSVLAAFLRPPTSRILRRNDAMTAGSSTPERYRTELDPFP